MTILRSLLSLICLILLLNILTGYLLHSQFIFTEQSLKRDIIIGEIIENESRLQLLAGNYLTTQNEQYLLQYNEVLKEMLDQVDYAEKFFLDPSNKESIQLIHKKIVQSKQILVKYKNNRERWEYFAKRHKTRKLEMSRDLDKQLHAQMLIVFQDMVLQTLRVRAIDEQNNHVHAESNTAQLYALLVISFLTVSLFSYIVFQRISNRINYISNAARQLGDGKLDIRIDSNQSDDMSYLIRTFNYMASQLELAEQKNNQMLQAAERQAYHDMLTKLPNRRFLLEQMDSYLARSLRQKTKGALIFIDLDNFKEINDSKGHSAGDKLLVEIAARMKAQVRAEDTLARIGGDEFVILLPDIGVMSDLVANTAAHIADKIKQAIKLPCQLNDHAFSITGSFGICIFPDDGNTSEELLSRSDIAMYQSKDRGRNCITFFSAAMHERMYLRIKLEEKLNLAITNNTLETWYQAKIDRHGNIVGAEALARWNDPEMGWISPEKFIPLAEKCGLILPLGRWLLEHVSQIMETWHSQRLCHIDHLSINISPHQFYESGFIERLLLLGRLFKSISTVLIVEITEGVLLNNSNEVIHAMAQLKNNGIRVSIDDFGTGYSSMAYLKHLSLDEIKIDKSFVSNIHIDKDNQVIVKTILSMAEHFGMTVVAEGVENKQELNYLKTMGCELFQGYFYSKPLPQNQFIEFLKQTHSKNQSSTR